MLWLLVLIIPVAVFVLVASRPMNIRREPFSEGPQEGDAVIAYDRIGNWPVFVLERGLILRALKKNPPAGILLDAGCGPGFLAASIAGRFKDVDVIGLDINSEMIEAAGHRWPAESFNKLNLVLGNIQQTSFPDESIDFIVSSLSLHHWENPEIAFCEIYRILKPGGRFLIFDLRRDSSRYFYYILKVGQVFFAPKAIRGTNGAVGSFRSGYVSSELGDILYRSPFNTWTIHNGLGWLLVGGQK